jgi:hypothetical protein
MSARAPGSETTTTTTAARKAVVERAYYVTVRDDGRTGFLLGPYATHGEALAQVDRGRELANGATPWAAFYAFGTSSLPAHIARETVFGK